MRPHEADVLRWIAWKCECSTIRAGMATGGGASRALQSGLSDFVRDDLVRSLQDRHTLRSNLTQNTYR